jgi:hypothetical protein
MVVPGVGIIMTLLGFLGTGKTILHYSTECQLSTPCTNERERDREIMLYLMLERCL